MHEDLKLEMAALIPRLRRFACALTGSLEEGDEIVQIAFVKALSRLDRFTPGGRLDHWMFRILRNSFIDTIRSRKRRRETADPELLDAQSDGGSAARRAEDRLTLAAVRRAFETLSAEQRVVIALVVIDGLSYREAAEVLGTPIGTVESRLSRARARLAYLLDEVFA